MDADAARERLDGTKQEVDQELADTVEGLADKVRLECELRVSLESLESLAARVESITRDNR